MKTQKNGTLAWFVALAVVAALSWLIVDVRQARRSVKMTQTVGNGRGIYMLMFAAEMDAYNSGSPRVFPTTNWPSSTAYFNAGATNIFADVEPSFFSSPGIPPAAQWPMQPENNAWSLNGSYTNWEGVSSEIPLLFTRNLRFRRSESGEVEPYLVDVEPFGKLGCVVVTVGGATKRLLRNTLQFAAADAKPEDVAHILNP